VWAQMDAISRLEAYKMFSNNSTRGLHQAVFRGPRASYYAPLKANSTASWETDTTLYCGKGV